MDSRNLVFSFLLVLGLLVALFGLGVDYIMPGASPGLNAPQLLIIVFGLSLAFVARQWRRYGVPRTLTSLNRKLGVRALVLALFTFLCLELALSLFGMPTYYPTERSEELLDLVPWWTCDELGCRFVYEAVVAECESGNFQDRRCIVNKQGFADDEDFVSDAALAGQFRILFLGDSFTHGFYASVGKSYVETVEKTIPESAVWNAGIGATGTNQAVATFSGIGPIFQPHLTVLGFYVNDFADNLFPADNIAWYLNSDGTVNFIRRYILDPVGNPVGVPLTVSQAAFVRAGRLPIPDELERRLGNTRLGSLLLSLKERLETLLEPTGADARFELAIERTRAYLDELLRQVELHDSELLVVMIDERQDAIAPLLRFTAAIELMHELRIPYMDTTRFIQAPDDYAAFPNAHWNNSGHQKVGMRLSNCIKAFMASGNLADCDQLVLR